MNSEQHSNDFDSEMDSNYGSYSQGDNMHGQVKHENGSSDTTQQSTEPPKAHIDIISDKPIKIVEKISIPVKQFPKFNFVGKLLGPRGLTFRRLQEGTLTRMAILGKGSMRDKDKEEEQRKEGGKYAHLNEELHVLVEVYAPPAEAHSRLAHALSELKRYLVPEQNDDIRQQQLEELAYLNGEPAAVGQPPAPRGPVSSAPIRGRGRGRPPVASGRGTLLATPGARGRSAPPPAIRGRGAVRPAIGRAPPVPHYEEEYGYEDYGAEPAYDSYDPGYQPEEYYDYGQGQSRSYDTYSKPPIRESWSRPSPATKAPPSRGPPKADYRPHPYSRPSY